MPNLERIILDKLNLVHPRQLTESVLLGDVRTEDATVSLSDLRQALDRLERKDQVSVITGEDAKRIKIKSAGQARLLE